MVDTCTDTRTPVGQQLRRSSRIITPLKRQIDTPTGKATPAKKTPVTTTTIRDSDSNTECDGWSSSSSSVVSMPRGKGQSQKRRRGGRPVTLVGDRAQKATIVLGVGTKVTPAGETPHDEIFDVFLSQGHNPRQRNSRSGYIQVLCKNAPCQAYCYASSNQRDDWYVTQLHLVNKVCIAAQQGMVVYDGVWGW